MKDGADFIDGLWRLTDWVYPCWVHQRVEQTNAEYFEAECRRVERDGYEGRVLEHPDGSGRVAVFTDIEFLEGDEE